jgi:calmodulin-lysine N-methyltransferase
MSKRWQTLRRALLPSASSSTDEQPNDVRFNLFNTERHQLNAPEFYSETSSLPDQSDLRVTLRLRKSGQVKIQELQRASNCKVDHTGNVCQWPCEEVLAYYCLQRSDRFNGKRVLELGAGMSGLAGQMVAALKTADLVVLTDGNDEATEMLRHNTALNVDNQAPSDTVRLNFVGFRGRTQLCVESLLWNRDESYLEVGQFDMILVSDCLFFVDFHLDLLHVLHRLLDVKGEVWICGPRRGTSMTHFIDLARTLEFDIECIENFDERVWKQHLEMLSGSDYDSDRHQPLLLVMRKKHQTLNSE